MARVMWTNRGGELHADEWYARVGHVPMCVFTNEHGAIIARAYVDGWACESVHDTERAAKRACVALARKLGKG